MAESDRTSPRKAPGVWHAAGPGGAGACAGAVRPNQVRTREPVWPRRGRGGAKAGTGPCDRHRSAHAPDICSEAAFARLQSAGGTEEAPGLPKFTAAPWGDLPRDFPTRSGAPPPSTPPSAQRPCHDGGWTLWIHRSEAPGRQQWRFRADTGALDSVTLCPPSHPSGGKKEAEPRLGPGPGHREVKGHAGVAAQPPAASEGDQTWRDSGRPGQHSATTIPREVLVARRKWGDRQTTWFRPAAALPRAPAPVPGCKMESLRGWMSSSLEEAHTAGAR